MAQKYVIKSFKLLFATSFNITSKIMYNFLFCFVFSFYLVKSTFVLMLRVLKLLSSLRLLT